MARTGDGDQEHGPGDDDDAVLRGERRIGERWAAGSGDSVG